MSDEGVAPRIVTRRFVLRPLTPDDATDRYLSWLQQDDTRRYILTAGQIRSLADLRAYIGEKTRCPDVVFLGIFDRQRGNHVGNIKYEPVKRREGYAVMGLLIGETAWRGKGVAAEVITASAQWLRDHHGISRIVLGVERSNQSAIRAYRKSGFRIETSAYVKSSSREIVSMVLYLDAVTGRTCSHRGRVPVRRVLD
jgi:RimJ/RimL family protein N-acetyltransferase